MTYALGLDLGTTYTAAATWRAGSVEMVGLGTHGAVIPSIVHLRADDKLLTGEAAVRRSLSEPGRSAREFKRRLGDPTPIVLGGTPYDAAELMKALLRDVAATVEEREGEAPAAVGIAHPANWGEFKIDLLRQAAIACDLRNVEMVSEPVAAAVNYTSKERVAIGETVAVYDLGGGTFDVAVLRRIENGFEPLGQPEGLERLGGIDFDHAVMTHVEGSLAEKLEGLDRSDPEVAASLARLRQECIAAKEGLSEDGEVTVPVALPGVWADVRITRPEFEAMIAPTLAEPLRAFNRALSSAGETVDTIHAVLLVGGSSRIPLVAETVAGALGRKIALDTHPKHAVALGAAQLVGASLTRTTPVPQPAVAASNPTRETSAAVLIEGSETSQVVSNPSGVDVPASVEQSPATPRPGRRRILAASASVVVALVIAAGAFFGAGGTGIVGAEDASVSDLDVIATDPTPETTPATIEPTRTTVAASPTSTVGAVATSTVEPAPTTTVETAPTSTVQSTPTSDPPPDTTPTPPACVAADGLCSFITDLAIVGDRYVVDYTTIGFEPRVVGEDAGAGPGDHHVHFFFNTTSPENAGSNGNPPGSWALWGLQRGGGRRVFDGFTVAQGNGADQLCVVVANDLHAVLSDAPSTGNCVALPA